MEKILDEKIIKIISSIWVEFSPTLGDLLTFDQ
jgi:hypothetical protein